MNILFLISQIPYPLDTGAKIRSYNLIKHLVQHHQITLVSFQNTTEDIQKVHALRNFCTDVKTIPRSDVNRTINKYGLLFLNLFSYYPYNIQKQYSRKMERVIANWTNEGKFDLLHCDSLQVSRNALSLNSLPKILTEHNLESVIFRRYCEKETNLIKKLYIYLQWLKLRRYEEMACKSFDYCVACSEHDKKILSDMVDSQKIHVIPNGVDTEYFRPTNHHLSLRTYSPQPNSLIFTGSMDWLPNEDAMVYFTSCIFPLIKKKIPKVMLSIVGRNPTKKLKGLTKEDRSIEVTGRVDDVRPYIARSSVYVVPLRIGSGTRLKILEAMAMGKPVISTTIGCEGIEATPGENIMVADDPKDFAEKTVELLRDSELRQKIGRAGRLLVEERYDWQRIAKLLDHVWKNAADRN